MGYVYLLSTVTPNGLEERFKIGFTTKPILNRIKSLQTGNSEKIILLNSYKSDNYLRIENMLHKKYFSCKANAKNEWFELKDEYVLSFLTDCKKLDETIKLLKENNPFFK